MCQEVAEEIKAEGPCTQLMKRRNELDDAKIGGLTELQDKSKGDLFTAWTAAGTKVAQTWFSGKIQVNFIFKLKMYILLPKR